MRKYNGVEIAIVGMAGQFPSASNTTEFWQLLRDGVEAVSEFSDEQLLARGVTAAALADPAYVKSGVVFAGMDQFDAAFFGYTPKDAENLDPQQRLFLESAWQALEDAGIDSRRESRPIGVYAGAGTNLYLQQHLQTSLAAQADVGAVLSLMNSNEKDALATRVAYKLDLRGPAMSVQTACSTSLVAVHQACRGLLNFDADIVLAGGVWLNLLQELGYQYQPGAILSPDGHCRAFDADAAGTVIGSGVGVVVLKRLEDALADGDHIYALIKGSAINNDGANKVSYSAPSVVGQANVILAAQSMAEVSAADISYIETHGTGTTLGDPIEIAALTQAFQASTSKTQFCAIASVKTNIGHLDAAAGVTGLIKTALALKNRYLPASLNFTQASPQIQFASSPFYVNQHGKPWTSANREPLRAGISSFGMGGTNAHVVLEEAPAINRAASKRSWHVLPLSAKTPTALLKMQANLLQHREQHPEQNIADVAFTLQTGRQQLNQRSFCLAQNNDCSQWMDGAVRDATSSNLVMMFPGQGAQHVDMGLALYQSELVFRQSVDQCCEQLEPLLGFDLKTVLYPSLYPSTLDRDAAASKLAQTELTQPALFVVEYAMALLWQSWGVRPSAMIGHSIGEYVAACLAGVFSLADALRLVVARGQLMQSLPAGAMLAVGLPETELSQYLNEDCSLAAVNAEGLCVASGSIAAIAQLENDLIAAGTSVVRRLHVSHAFHSSIVEPILPEFIALLNSIQLNAPTMTLISNVTGLALSREQAQDPAYWAQHLRGTVRFADGINTVLANPASVLLEVGPGDTLSKLVRRRADLLFLPIASQAHPLADSATSETIPAIAMAVGSLWLAGIDIAWSAICADERRYKVTLPTYPFERQSYWARSTAQPVIATTPPRGIDDWFYTPSWQRIELPRNSESDLSGVVLVFADQTGLADALLAELVQQRVIMVDAGDAYIASADRYTIRVDEAGDYQRLMREVGEKYGDIAQIFHLLNVTASRPDFASAQALGFFSLLYLMQALPSQALSLTVVANHLADISGIDPICAAKATLLGACKVIPQEYPKIHCQAIDIVAGNDGLENQQIAQQLLAEARAKADETLVALRRGWRWRQTFESVARPQPERSSLRDGGVYLITGGLGGIGLALAEYMARSVKAKLVLLARTPLPERSIWGRGDFDASTRNKIEQIQQLEGLGAEVLVLAVDICDTAALNQALEQVRARFGAIHGVIHAAGVAGGGVMSLKTPEAIARVFAPKMQGTTALLTAVARDNLDFMALCSSITGLVGGFGQVDYCAANLYLDALAAEYGKQLPIVSINWDSWRDVGMAAHLQAVSDLGLDPQLGCMAFERILNHGRQAQIMVSTQSWSALLEYTQKLPLSHQLLEPLLQKTHCYPRPALSQTYLAPNDDLESGLAELWSAALGLAPIGINDHLFELGGDSLLAIQILSKVRAIWEVEIHPADFFKNLSIAGLAQLVEIKLIEELETA
ncbi:type I polyketide synthase [Deefgea rivuli]|uniref:type I polyketide synthase n=1 Tax=Deefgea rivuli TaxID=400948 RepID=UPI000482A3E8|nr:type I polyketide synthase [Deefgea rivuli]